MIISVQCNCTCRLSTWSTKIFWGKSSLKTRIFFRLKKFSGSTCRFSTNFQWSTSGLWRKKTNKSWCTFRTSCPKAAYQTENIFQYSQHVPALICGTDYSPCKWSAELHLKWSPSQRNHRSLRQLVERPQRFTIYFLWVLSFLSQKTNTIFLLYLE